MLFLWVQKFITFRIIWQRIILTFQLKRSTLALSVGSTVQHSSEIQFWTVWKLKHKSSWNCRLYSCFLMTQQQFLCIWTQADATRSHQSILRDGRLKSRQCQLTPRLTWAASAFLTVRGCWHQLPESHYFGYVCSVHVQRTSAVGQKGILCYDSLFLFRGLVVWGGDFLNTTGHVIIFITPKTWNNALFLPYM